MRYQTIHNTFKRQIQKLLHVIVNIHTGRVNLLSHDYIEVHDLTDMVIMRTSMDQSGHNLIIKDQHPHNEDFNGSIRS